MSRWLDISYGIISLGWAEQRKQEGYAGLIQCSLAWPGKPDPIEHAEKNLSYFRKVGLGTMTYMAIGGNYPDRVAGYINSAREVSGDEWNNCSFAWVDIETMLAFPESSMSAAIDQTEKLGLDAGFYSSLSKWHQHAANTMLFKGRYGWQALWNGNPDIYNTFQYGGLKTVGKQYEHDLTIGGVKCDVSTFSDSFLIKPIPSKEDIMLPEDKTWVENISIARSIQFGTERRLVAVTGTPDVYVVTPKGKKLYTGGQAAFEDNADEWDEILYVSQPIFDLIPNR